MQMLQLDDKTSEGNQLLKSKTTYRLLKFSAF